jgi:hypothetical protein
MVNVVGQPGPEETSAHHQDFEDLARRVLILEQRLRQTSQPSPEIEPARGRSESTGAQAGPDATAAATPILGATYADTLPRGLGLTNYLGAAVVKASNSLLEYDAAARTGDEDQTAYWAEQVAGVSCRGLSRIVDEFDFDLSDPGSEVENELLSHIRQAGGLSDRQTLVEFRDIEVAILTLIGLNDALAATLVGDLAGIYVGGTSTSGPFGKRAEDAQRSVCALHSRLVAERERRVAAAPPTRRRKKLWTAVIALGGGLVFVANAAGGGAIFGPAGVLGGVAASQYIGSSAWDLASVFLRD